MVDTGKRGLVQGSVRGSLDALDLKLELNSTRPARCRLYTPPEQSACWDVWEVLRQRNRKKEFPGQMRVCVCCHHGHIYIRGIQTLNQKKSESQLKSQPLGTRPALIPL